MLKPVDALYLLVRECLGEGQAYDDVALVLQGFVEPDMDIQKYAGTWPFWSDSGIMVVSQVSRENDIMQEGYEVMPVNSSGGRLAGRYAVRAVRLTVCLASDRMSSRIELL